MTQLCTEFLPLLYLSAVGETDSWLITFQSLSAVSSISRQQRQWSRPSLSPAGTIVTHSCTDCRLHKSTGCAQRVQKPATRVVARAGRREHITTYSAFPAPLASRAVPHHRQDPVFNLPCPARSCPCVSHWVAGLLCRPSRALRSGQQQLLRIPRPSCAPVRKLPAWAPSRKPSKPTFRICLQPPPRNQWQLILT